MSDDAMGIDWCSCGQMNGNLHVVLLSLMGDNQNRMGYYYTPLMPPPLMLVIGIRLSYLHKEEENISDVGDTYLRTSVGNSIQNKVQVYNEV